MNAIVKHEAGALAVQIPVGDLWALVDPEDAPLLLRHRWHVSKMGGSIYAHRNISKTPRATESMHRMIMGAPAHRWLVIDHIDGNGLNNTKANLRFTTKVGNGLNRKADAGVRRTKAGRWTARVAHTGNYQHLGTFDTREEALAVRNAAVQKYFMENQQ